MIRLSYDEILSLHSKLVQRYGGSDGIHDARALDAALNTPFQTFGGMELYPTVIDKAVRLAYGMITDHPFIDGNKRIGAIDEAVEHGARLFMAFLSHPDDITS